MRRLLTSLADVRTLTVQPAGGSDGQEIQSHVGRFEKVPARHGAAMQKSCDDELFQTLAADGAVRTFPLITLDKWFHVRKGRRLPAATNTHLVQLFQTAP